MTSEQSIKSLELHAINKIISILDSLRPYSDFECCVDDNAKEQALLLAIELIKQLTRIIQIDNLEYIDEGAAENANLYRLFSLLAEVSTERRAE